MGKTRRAYAAECRRQIVEPVMEQGGRVREAAIGIGPFERRVYIWLARFRREGMAGLRDRSSRPHRVPWRTSVSQIQRAIALAVTLLS